MAVAIAFHELEKTGLPLLPPPINVIFLSSSNTKSGCLGQSGQFERFGPGRPNPSSSSSSSSTSEITANDGRGLMPDYCIYWNDDGGIKRVVVVPKNRHMQKVWAFTLKSFAAGLEVDDGIAGLRKRVVLGEDHNTYLTSGGYKVKLAAYVSMEATYRFRHIDTTIDLISTGGEGCYGSSARVYRDIPGSEIQRTRPRRVVHPIPLLHCPRVRGYGETIHCVGHHVGKDQDENTMKKVGIGSARTEYSQSFKVSQSRSARDAANNASARFSR
jgi:hypothetical protein